MNFLAKLRQIGIDLSKLEKISLFEINLNIDKSVHVDAKNSHVSVNPSLLNGKQRAGLRQAIATEGLDEAGAIIDVSAIPTLDLIRSELPAIQKMSQMFVPLIPPQDVPLLQACLYLRQRFKLGERIDDLKGQIVQVYGQRGRNLANLCSANYLEDWFIPLYEALCAAYPDDPAKAKSQFLSVYNSVLLEQPWTEFVSQRTTGDKLVAGVADKMNRNLKNGVRFLNLHGLGPKNVAKILEALPKIKTQTGAEAVKIDTDQARIFVRLAIPPAVE